MAPTAPKLASRNRAAPPHHQQAARCPNAATRSPCLPIPTAGGFEPAVRHAGVGDADCQAVAALSGESMTCT